MRLSNVLETGLCMVAVASIALAAAPGVASAQDDGGMTFDPVDVGKAKNKQAKPPPDNKPQSKTLQRGIKLYDDGDFKAASIELHKVVSGSTPDSAANKQRAEFFLGKTLYKMGYYAGALAYFDKIVQVGHGHRYYGATLKWLAALSRVLPDTSGILAKIGTYDPAQLEDPVMDEVRDELYYLLGRYYYGAGQLDSAVAMFQRVDVTSPFYLESKFMEGVTFVRKYDGKPAVQAFKDLLVIGQERPKQFKSAEIDKYEELARLNLARIFYSTRQYNLSIKYYEKIPQSSPDWTESLFEASWAYFMKSNNSKALGNIHTLNAPYFENQFFPESVLLKAVIYHKYCLYDRAMESVLEYDSVYRPLREDLKEILSKHEDNAEFYKYVLTILDGKAGLPDRSRRLVLGAIEYKKSLQKAFNWVKELDRELSKLEHADKAWRTTEVSAGVLQELSLQQSLAMAEAGRLARQEIQGVADQLRKLSRDALKVRIEVLNGRAGQISAKMRGEQVSGTHEPEPIVIDDEHFLWKFKGEYWKDELGYYRFKIRSKCPRGAGK